jgi:hypothetical protein
VNERPREVTGERIGDKIAAWKMKGIWMGGNTPLPFCWAGTDKRDPGARARGRLQPHGSLLTRFWRKQDSNPRFPRE